MAIGVAIARAISKNRDGILEAWLASLAGLELVSMLPKAELRTQCGDVIKDLAQLESYDLGSPAASKTRDRLVEISRRRGLQGFSPTDTALFVFSIKDAAEPFLKEELKGKPAQLAEETAQFNRLIDQLVLETFAVYTERRDAYTEEQQKSILELSTPVVEVWEGVLALPVVGPVDTARTQQMMESLLNKIVDTGSKVVIIDITGVPVVDTAVAKHLMQTVNAAKLLGAQCILVGISARIAQTLVHLGVELSGTITGTTLARGLELALKMTDRKIVAAD